MLHHKDLLWLPRKGYPVCVAGLHGADAERKHLAGSVSMVFKLLERDCLLVVV